jgi:hypothetical protein
MYFKIEEAYAPIFQNTTPRGDLVFCYNKLKLATAGYWIAFQIAIACNEEALIYCFAILLAETHC